MDGTSDQADRLVKTSPASPIGIVDSGWGGLTVWKSITKLLPHESTVYVGDHRFVPYGERSVPWIRKRTVRLIRFLKEKGVKMIVIACNTATIAGIAEYRKQFPDLPIIGVVPVVKTAAEKTKTGTFAILSTPRTSRSAYQKNLILRFASRCQVTVLESAQLVPYIEKGETGSPAIRKELKRLLGRISVKTDVIVLGCTHYPFVRAAIRDIVRGRVRLLDSGGAVARHVARILQANRKRERKGKPAHTFYTTAADNKPVRAAKKLVGSRQRISYARI